MKYHLVFGNSLFSADDPDELEAAWRKLRAERDPVAFVPDGFQITLPISLDARVERTRGNPTEKVILTSGGREVTLIRDAFGHPEGQLCVSCSPNGPRVDVDTINIQFRSLDDDDCTDRGLVWVTPNGRDGKVEARVVLKPGAFKRSGMVAELVRTAEQAIERDVLSHFTAQLARAN